MTSKVVKYIWTYPLAILLIWFADGDLEILSPKGILILMILVGGVIGYIVDVVVSSIRAKRLEM